MQIGSMNRSKSTHENKGGLMIYEVALPLSRGPMFITKPRAPSYVEIGFGILRITTAYRTRRLLMRVPVGSPGRTSWLGRHLWGYF